MVGSLSIDWGVVHVDRGVVIVGVGGIGGPSQKFIIASFAEVVMVVLVCAVVRFLLLVGVDGGLGGWIGEIDGAFGTALGSQFGGW